MILMKTTLPVSRKSNAIKTLSVDISILKYESLKSHEIDDKGGNI